MAEKYLIGLFCAAAAVVIGGLFVTVIPLHTGTTPDKDALSLLAGSVCAILLINGIIPAAAATALGPKKPA